MEQAEGKNAVEQAEGKSAVEQANKDEDMLNKEMRVVVDESIDKQEHNKYERRR